MIRSNRTERGATGGATGSEHADGPRMSAASRHALHEVREARVRRGLPESGPGELCEGDFAGFVARWWPGEKMPLE